EAHARLAEQITAHDDASSLRAGRHRGAALLLSSQAPRRRQLPHVPRRIRHADDRPRPQTDPQRRWHAKDRAFGAALRSCHPARRIVLADERCILCSRCVRFTKDIVGDDALGFVNRGSYSTLTHFPGRPFDNNYTLSTVDLCPVGALTSKDFRFQMRVWFLKETKSLCTSC